MKVSGTSSLESISAKVQGVQERPLESESENQKLFCVNLQGATAQGQFLESESGINLHGC